MSVRRQNTCLTFRMLQQWLGTTNLDVVAYSGGEGWVMVGGEEVSHEGASWLVRYAHAYRFLNVDTVDISF
jgi:hypothetical protein